MGITNILILMVGLPRSGKTTWALQKGFPIVSPDAMRLAIHGTRYNATLEPLVWGVCHLMMRSLFKAGHQTVIIDATSITEERRKFWEPKEGDAWECILQLVDTPKDVCIERALLYGDKEIIPVIERMDKSFERPVGPFYEKAIGASCE